MGTWVSSLPIDSVFSNRKQRNWLKVKIGRSEERSGYARLPGRGEAADQRNESPPGPGLIVREMSSVSSYIQLPGAGV